MQNKIGVKLEREQYGTAVFSLELCQTTAAPSPRRIFSHLSKSSIAVFKVFSLSANHSVILFLQAFINFKFSELR